MITVTDVNDETPVFPFPEYAASVPECPDCVQTLTIKGTVERPRLSVFRSNENIYAQIIDDTTAKTLVSCSTLDRDIKLNSENEIGRASCRERV